VAHPDRLHRPDLTRVEVYGDESLKRGGFDLLGALSLSAAEAADLRRAVTELRASTIAPNPYGEMKWTKCSGATENPLFAAAIDLTMSRIRQGRARFKCIVIDRSLVDNDAERRRRGAGVLQGVADAAVLAR
jgi:hypothetical protein